MLASGPQQLTLAQNASSCCCATCDVHWPRPACVALLLPNAAARSRASVVVTPGLPACVPGRLPGPGGNLVPGAGQQLLSAVLI